MSSIFDISIWGSLERSILKGLLHALVRVLKKVGGGKRIAVLVADWGSVRQAVEPKDTFFEIVLVDCRPKPASAELPLFWALSERYKIPFAWLQPPRANFACCAQAICFRPTEVGTLKMNFELASRDPSTVVAFKILTFMLKCRTRGMTRP
jgi:hypothetical protein